jgi:negative regulator of genetic competence, sporulation and motility
LFAVPITLSIEFEKINDLISFVHNVEKRLITIPQDRILYKIQEVGYDIVASSKPQTTEISMIAYYYHDPRFQDMVPVAAETSSPTELSSLPQ